MSSTTTTTVRLVVYDISGGMARTIGQSMLGLDLDCIPHTGILVFGLEYFFGGGIQKMPHELVKRSFGLSPIRTEVLGMTDKSAEDFHVFLDSISSQFQQSTYDVFRNNCNHFSDTAVKYLLNGVGIPTEIVSLPDRVLATPMGQMIAPIWAGMQTRLQNELVPFNNNVVVTPSIVAPMPTSSSSFSTRTPTLVESIKGLTETCTPNECMVALETISKILNNIIQHPLEEKYRRLSLKNERFHAAIGRHKHALGCLLALSFQVDGNFIFMVPDPNKWDKLVMSEKILNAARKKAIKGYFDSSNVKNKQDALKLVDGKDPLVMEIVNQLPSE